MGMWERWRSGRKGWMVALLLGMAIVLAAGCTGGGGGTDSTGDGSGSGSADAGAGGGGGTAAESSGGGTAPDPYDGLPLEISINVLNGGVIDSSEGTWADNRWTRWMEEQSGVKVNWIEIPLNFDMRHQTLSTMFATGTAPDVISLGTQPFLRGLVDQGALMPVGDLVETYSTAYKAYIQDYPELKPYMEYKDEWYFLAAKRPEINLLDHGMFIRQDWLDRVGLPMPQTLDDFIQVARAFKTQDPDNNGANDTFGLTFDFREAEMLTNMFEAGQFSFYDEDGSMMYGSLTDRYVDSLAFQRLLFEEGLIDQEFLTDTDFQRQWQHWITGKAGIYFGAWNVDHSDLITNDPGAVVVPLEAPLTEYGRGLRTAPQNTWMFSLNKDTQNPKAAMQFLDWMHGEGWHALMYGFEGEHYNLVNGVEVPIDPGKNDKELAYAYWYMMGFNNSTQNADYIRRQAENTEEPVLKRRLELNVATIETVLRNEFRVDFPVEPSFPELQELRTSYQPVHNNIRVRVLTGQLTPEAAVEQLRAEWKRLGGDSVDGMLAEWYAANAGSR